MRIINPKTNNLVNPIGINGDGPEFSWQLLADGESRRQGAWQIRAGRDAALDGDAALLWDSGKVAGGIPCAHRYGGAPLASRQRVHWQVRVWDEDDAVSEWSPAAFFETGLLDRRDWDAQWIGFPGAWSGHAVCFQKYFEAPEGFRQARLYLGGPSWSESWINGARLGGKAVLQPAQSDFAKSWHYLTYDITEWLTPGQNVLAIQAGASFYGVPCICYRVEADGVLLTRSHYLDMPDCRPSPIFRNSVYGGEEYDARKEIPHSWMRAGGFRFQRSAMRVSGLAGVPRGLEEEPIVPQEELQVAQWRPLDNGGYSADFGRNFAGWCRLKVRAASGTRIEMRFSEMRHPDGTANQDNLLGEQAVDAYVAKGAPEGEVYEPHFTYHGFRYVEVRGLPCPPDSGTLTGIVLRTDCATTGDFSCGNELVNRIFAMIRHTEESNLHAIPTDCPQRTERMGWLNDMMARCESALYLFDESNLLAKWLRDIAEAQNPETGDVPMTAPLYWGFDIDPACSSFIEAAWLSYAFHGKRLQLELLYGHFCRWTQYMLDCCDRDGILRRGGWVGDWVPPLKYNCGHDSPQNFTVPHELTSTALMHYALMLQSRIARIVGQDDSAARRRAESVQKSFLRAFRTGPGRLQPESQSAYAYAVYCGLFPDDERQTAADRLAELLQANGCKHTTGNIGTKYLLETLSQYGHADLAWALIRSTDYPGWGYMLENGATTLWERWELAEGDGMNSHNHPMLGCPCAWLFRYLGGIKVLPDSVGFDRFELSPYFPADLDHAEVSYASRNGQIKVSWRRAGDGTVALRLQVPAGSRALLRLPGRQPQTLNPGSHELRLTA